MCSSFGGWEVGSNNQTNESSLSDQENVSGVQVALEVPSGGTPATHLEGYTYPEHVEAFSQKEVPASKKIGKALQN